MAMKVLKVADKPREEDYLSKLKNEVEILARTQHNYIVEFITSEVWDASVVRIFMSLKEGNLATLARQSSSSSIQRIYKTVLRQMLEALDYLDAKYIVHRDVKPENVLYSTAQGSFHFQLGDFGLATKTGIRRGFYGTPVFMAPEVVNGDIHTPKADVWSLYVTIVWVLDDQGFREKSDELKLNQGAEQLSRGIWNLLLPIPTRFRNYHAMIQVDASSRASAGDMLQQLYHGEGRTTPKVDHTLQDKTSQ
ncbi:hypothetical protein N0V84_008575 [Fusarium piperis]|uniref:Protein kinase domain-containing protein n=1 Tax=Fusarium piperis TaxID=1435070 RepID=A0A9W9BKB2_9HYPO|nr:hypothetical protein N0V84_008575 [Fusarium piperis]